MSGATVSASYLMGIREGRSLLTSIKARGETVTRADAQRFFENARNNMRRGFDRELTDTFKGERDFWANLINKGVFK